MIRRVLIVVAGLAGGVGASQAPEFMQQYTQRLGGAVQELTRVIEHFRVDAASEGLALDTAFARYQASPDAFLQKRGTSMERSFARFERISAHQQQIQGATAFDRPALLWRYHDRALLKGTMSDFRPAVPTTAEGAVYAFCGFILGAGIMMLLLGGLGRLLRWAWNPRRDDAARP